MFAQLHSSRLPRWRACERHLASLLEFLRFRCWRCRRDQGTSRRCQWRVSPDGRMPGLSSHPIATSERGSRGPRSDLHLRPAFDLGQQRRPAITSAGNDSPISRLDCLEGIRSSRWRVVNGCSPMSTRHACKRDRRSSGVSGPPIGNFSGRGRQRGHAPLVGPYQLYSHFVRQSLGGRGTDRRTCHFGGQKKMRCTGRLLAHGCVGFVPRAVKPWKRPKYLFSV